MIPFRQTIGFRLLLVSVILLALPLLVDAFILSEHRYEENMDAVKRYLVETANMREVALAEAQPIGKESFDLMEYYLALDKGFPKEFNPALNEELAKLAEASGLTDVMLLEVNDKGHYIVMASGLLNFLGKDLTTFFQDPSPFSEESERTGFADYTLYNPETLEPYGVIARGVRDPETGKELGVIAVFSDTLSKAELLVKPDPSYFQARFALLLPSSVVVVASDPNFRFNYFKPLSEREKELFLVRHGLRNVELAPKPIETTREGGSIYQKFMWDGQEQIGYFRTVPKTNITLLSYVNASAMYDRPLYTFIWIYITYILVLIIGMGISYFMTRRLALPVRELSVVMSRIREGDLTARYSQDRFGFEFNRLGHIFNQMVDTLLEKEEIAEKERIHRETLVNELRLGQKVQRHLLLDRLPSFHNLEVGELYIPAKEVGGDFFDIYMKENGKLLLTVADASGKGVQACSYSLILRNMLRTFANVTDDVSELMRLANNLFCEDTGDTGMFVTTFMASYDPISHELTYYSFGHNPAILCRTDGKIEYLEHIDIAMGVIQKPEPLHVQSVFLEPGDTLYLYTDGITEAHNIDNAMYGEERFERLIEIEQKRTVQHIIGSLVEDIDRFVKGAKQHDDITLLVMRVKQ